MVAVGACGAGVVNEAADPRTPSHAGGPWWLGGVTDCGTATSRAALLTLFPTAAVSAALTKTAKTTKTTTPP